jgi:peptide/nickel transport system substrate-binding protein
MVFSDGARRLPLAGLVMALAACGGSRAEGEPGVIEIGEQRQSSSFTRNFNPLLELGDVRWPAKAAMYEPLLIWNALTGAFVPWLAESYRFSEDHLRLDFQIRRGVTWSDGKPFTARDVAFTFHLVKKVPALDLRNMWQFLADVRAIGDDAVAFHFVRPLVPSIEDISSQPIVPEHVWKDVADPFAFTNDHPVATGPFTEITSFKPQAYRVDRNPRYWKGLPSVKALHFRAYPANDQTILAIINDDLDWAGNFIPAVERIHVARDPAHHGYWFPAIDAMVMLFANTTVPPFGDVRVRKALSMAIDRQRVVTVAMHGYTHPADATGLSDAYDRLRDPAAVAAGAGWMKHDPEGARRLLDEAGVVIGPDGWRRGPDGTRLRLSLLVPVGFSDWVVASQIIARGLRKVGLDAGISTIDMNAWTEKLQRGEFVLSMGGTLPSYTPYGFYRGMLSRKTARPIGEDAPENWHRFGVPEADEAFTTLEATTDPAEERRLYHALEAMFAAHAPAIPLFPGPLWGSFTTKRFTGFSDAHDPYAPLSPNLIPQALMVLTRLSPR